MKLSPIIEAAKKHVHGWQFCELAGVAWSAKFRHGGLWYPPHEDKLARIEMGSEQDTDVLWHEVFHSVFHNSPLRKNNGWWGEAFCNAFSEVTRQCFYRTSYSLDDREKALVNLHWRRYIVPCVLILQHVDLSPGDFFIFWKDINEKAQADPSFCLNSFLRYSPETGLFCADDDLTSTRAVVS